MFSVSERKYFISLVRSALRGEAPREMAQDVSFINILNLAKLHNLTELIAYAVPEISPKPEEILVEKINKLKMTGTAQQIHQDIEMEAITATFKEQGIDFLILKGYKIKSLYPRTDMRSMCDIDILVRPEQLKRAKGVMLSHLGYKESDIVVGEHDLGFNKPPFISIEIHHTMTDKGGNTEAYKYYKNVWSLARKKEGEEYEYEFSPEDFYIHHIEHMTKHYRYGGCGVRAFCDVFVLLERYKDTLDFEYIEKTLGKMRLDVFEKHIRNASYKWFGDGEGDEVTEQIEEYVLRGGTYGMSADKEKTALARNHTRDGRVNKLSYFWGKIFLPYKHMKNGYPVLRKVPILLPFCWIHRILNRLLFKRDRVKRQLTIASSTDEINEYLNHISNVGLN